MPVHDMTLANARHVGQAAIHGPRCPACGYGSPPSEAGTLAGIAHAASCPSREAESVRGSGGYLACDNDDCKKVLDAERVRAHGAKTCGDKCRAAAWKAAHNYGRHDPPQRRANGKPSGLQISYRKAVDLLAFYFAEQDPDTSEDPHDRADFLLRDALSDRQRRQLEDRQHEGSST